MQEKDQKKAFIYGGIAVAAWSTVATAFKICLRFMTPEMMLFLSALVSTIVLLAVNISQKKFSNFLRQSWKDYLRSALLGSLNPFIYYLILFEAYNRLPAQLAQPLNYTWPIVLMLLAAPILKQPITLRNVLAVLISFAGVILISTEGRIFSMHIDDPPGVGLAVGSSVFWALYWLLNVRDHRDESVKLLTNFIFGSIYITVYMLITGYLKMPEIEGIAAAFYVGMFEMGITFVFWMKAMSYAESSAKVGNLIYLSPFFSLVLIHYVLDENILISTIFGLVFVVTGIIVQNAKRKKLRRN